MVGRRWGYGTPIMPFDRTIEPRGPFSLAAAATFGFGPHTGRELVFDGVMRLAFPVDGGGAAGVAVRQEPDGLVRLEIEGDGDPDAVTTQVARVLSLDHDGEEWMRVGDRDPVIGRLQRTHPGQRPVLFYSPYEACAWSIISARRGGASAATTRRQISASLGRHFTVEGELMDAFPPPERLLDLEPMPGLPPERIARLRGVAQAALEGRLDVEHLREIGPEAAAAEVRSLRGIGPFYGALVVLRATGFADAVLDVAETKVLGHATRFYGRDAPLTQPQLIALAEVWRPFRTWAIVLLRLAGDRADLR